MLLVSLAGKKSELGNIVKRLAHRWFVVRDAKSEKLTLLNPRFAMSFLRGPMTGVEIRRAKGEVRVHDA